MTTRFELGISMFRRHKVMRNLKSVSTISVVQIKYHS